MGEAINLVNNFKVEKVIFNCGPYNDLENELKITEFKVEYISQVQKYMNYIDKNVKEISNNFTIGILICKRENKFVIEYCSDGKILENTRLCDIIITGCGK